jgi:hypothetical protein
MFSASAVGADCAISGVSGAMGAVTCCCCRYLAAHNGTISVVRQLLMVGRFICVQWQWLKGLRLLWQCPNGLRLLWQRPKGLRVRVVAVAKGSALAVAVAKGSARVGIMHSVAVCLPASQCPAFRSAGGPSWSCYYHVNRTGPRSCVL